MHDKKMVIEAFTELAPRYEQVVNRELQKFWGWSYSSFINNLIFMTPIEDGQSILDIATGTGVIPRKLVDSKKTQGQITGLDITYAMLERAKRHLASGQYNGQIQLTCATAHSMPYAEASFDVVMCGLATHHMDVSILTTEIHRVLKGGGLVSISDVGGSPTWRLGSVRAFIRILAFIYFSIAENVSRAWAEAAALTNIRTAEEWGSQLKGLGFSNIKIVELPSSHFWTPAPLVIQAIKPKMR